MFFHNWNNQSYSFFFFFIFFLSENVWEVRMRICILLGRKSFQLFRNETEETNPKKN